MAMVDDPRRIDVVVGVLFAALLLEAARRHIGAALVILTLVFVAYAFAGPWLPGFTRPRRRDVPQAASICRC